MAFSSLSKRSFYYEILGRICSGLDIVPIFWEDVPKHQNRADAKNQLRL